MAHNSGRKARPCITVSRATLTAAREGCRESGHSGSVGVRSFTTCSPSRSTRRGALSFRLVVWRIVRRLESHCGSYKTGLLAKGCGWPSETDNLFSGEILTDLHRYAIAYPRCAIVGASLNLKHRGGNATLSSGSFNGSPPRRRNHRQKQPKAGSSPVRATILSISYPPRGES